MCVMVALGLTRKTAATKTTTTAFATTAGATTAGATTATATAATIAASVATATTALALGHHVDAGACGIWLALAATLGFVAKGVDATLGA